MIALAPSDAALFEMLKHAHWNSNKIDWKYHNYGFDLNLMPDTEYMVWMIMYFNPQHELPKTKINNFEYFPVLHWHSAKKFDSPEIKEY